MSDPADLNVSAQVKTFFKNGGKTYPDLHDQPFSPKKAWSIYLYLATSKGINVFYRIPRCQLLNSFLLKPMVAMKKSGNIDIFQDYCYVEYIVDRLKDYFCEPLLWYSKF